MSSEGIRVLEEKHMISIMMHLSDNDGCTKTDLYGAVSNNPRMPQKLDILEASGMIVQESIPDSRAVRIRLTDVGKRVCDSLVDMDRMISQ